MRKNRRATGGPLSSGQYPLEAPKGAPKGALHIPLNRHAACLLTMLQEQQHQQQRVLLLLSLFLLCLLFVAGCPAVCLDPLPRHLQQQQQQQEQQKQQQQQQHDSLLRSLFAGRSASDVHAVIVCTSRQWHNYRHTTNALSMYTLLKQQGVSDRNIILMLAGEDGPCTPRNPFPAGVYRHRSRTQNLFGGHDVCAYRLENKQQQQPQQQQQQQTSDEEYRQCAAGASGWEGVEADYKGNEVTVRALVSVLTGLHGPHTPEQQRMHSSSSSTVLVFLTGHGGDEFLKFSDWEVLLQQQLTETVELMHALRRFSRLLLIAETCQASTLLSGIRTPGVLRISSSLKGESSYSYTGDREVGAALVDRWTHSALNFMCSQANQYFAAAAAAAAAAGSSSRRKRRGSSRGVGRMRAPFSELLESLDHSFLMSTCGVEEQTVPGSPSLTALPLEAFFSLRGAPLPFLFNYPLGNTQPSTPAAAPAAAAAAALLRSSEWLRFSPNPTALTRHMQQPQQQEQHRVFEALDGQAAAWLSVLLFGAACAATSSLLF
ncbi:hypothetical protein Efla_000814 [Eimeria flavescens]